MIYVYHISVECILDGRLSNYLDCHALQLSISRRHLCPTSTVQQRMLALHNFGHQQDTFT